MSEYTKRFLNAIFSGFFVGGLAILGAVLLKLYGISVFAWYHFVLFILFGIQILIGKALRYGKLK